MSETASSRGISLLVVYLWAYRVCRHKVVAAMPSPVFTILSLVAALRCKHLQQSISRQPSRRLTAVLLQERVVTQITLVIKDPTIILDI